jgi:hypothetical protein
MGMPAPCSGVLGLGMAPPITPVVGRGGVMPPPIGAPPVGERTAPNPTPRGRACTRLRPIEELPVTTTKGSHY